MGLFSSFDINASGMTAQRYRMDVISENLANAYTTRTQDGTPYRRKVVSFEQRGEGVSEFGRMFNRASDSFKGKGVRVGKVMQDTWTEMVMAYDPSHPDADENGYVTYPNVSVVTEMTNLIDASRSFEANATAFSASEAIAVKGLEMSQQ